MRVEAFHSGSSAADSAEWARADVIGRDGGITFGGVSAVGGGQRFRVHRGLGSSYATGRFQLRDRPVQLGIDQPVAGGKRRAVGEKCSIPDHDRITVRRTNDHGERGTRGSAEEFRHARFVIDLGHRASVARRFSNLCGLGRAAGRGLARQGAIGRVVELVVVADVPGTAA